MAFPHEEFPASDHCTKFEKKGPFWSEEFSDEILNSYLDQIFTMSPRSMGKNCKR